MRSATWASGIPRRPRWLSKPVEELCEAFSGRGR